MASLLLDVINWDLCVDADGNIAVGSAPYSYAQDAACAMRLFAGELYYDTSQGVPYFADILGHWPAPSVLKAYMTQAALTATGVENAVMFFTSWTDRVVQGPVYLTVAGGASINTFFSASALLARPAPTPVPIPQPGTLTWLALQALYPGSLFLNGGVVMASPGVFPSSAPTVAGVPWSNGGVLQVTPGGTSALSPSWISLVSSAIPDQTGFVFLNGTIVMVTQ